MFLPIEKIRRSIIDLKRKFPKKNNTEIKSMVLTDIRSQRPYFDNEIHRMELIIDELLRNFI